LNKDFERYLRQACLRVAISLFNIFFRVSVVLGKRKWRVSDFC
jgi:hypothetical protein